MGFIDVMNNHLIFDECSPEYQARELINIFNIQHVYVVMPEKKDIAIEYLTYDGKPMKIIECFKNELQCNARYNEIKKILKAK